MQMSNYQTKRKTGNSMCIITTITHIASYNYGIQHVHTYKKIIFYEVRGERVYNVK